MTLDPLNRFTDRVADYGRARPSYPMEVISLMRDALDLRPHHIIADVGSGTGILSRLFLDCGNPVLGVEPNAAMRAAAEEALEGYRHFHSVSGRAEATALTDESVDFIVVGQAFHWFDVGLTAREFRRILQPTGWVVILWNQRRSAGSPFLAEYEALLERWGTDYRTVRACYDLTPKLEELFRPTGYETRSFPHAQELDRTGLRARLLSSSYVPGPDHPDRAPMLEELDGIFDGRRVNDRVLMEYDTHAHFGRLRSESREEGRGSRE